MSRKLLWLVVPVSAAGLIAVSTSGSTNSSFTVQGSPGNSSGLFSGSSSATQSPPPSAPCANSDPGPYNVPPYYEAPASILFCPKDTSIQADPNDPRCPEQGNNHPGALHDYLCDVVDKETLVRQLGFPKPDNTLAWYEQHASDPGVNADLQSLETERGSCLALATNYSPSLCRP